MHRRDRDRTIDSDPATAGALGVPKELEPTGDPAGLHTEGGDIDRMLDRDERDDDEVTARPHERDWRDRVPDPQNPEELAADAIALATQGGGSIDEDDRDLEAEVDRDAIAAGIVPQLVGQATLESASVTDSSVLEEEDVDEEAPTLPRSRPGRTGVGRVARRDAR
jgi:hypothetical protein